jgi:hypothetical protein
VSLAPAYRERIRIEIGASRLRINSSSTTRVGISLPEENQKEVSVPKPELGRGAEKSKACSPGRYSNGTKFC